MNRGTRLKKLRKTFDLTQDDVLAQTLTPKGARVSDSTYKRAEDDDPKSGGMSMDTLKGIAHAFDLKPAVLDDYLDGKVDFETIRELARPHVEHLKKTAAERAQRSERNDTLLRAFKERTREIAPGLDGMLDAKSAEGEFQGSETECLRELELLNESLLKVYRQRTSGRHRVR